MEGLTISYLRGRDYCELEPLKSNYRKGVSWWKLCVYVTAI